MRFEHLLDRADDATLEELLGGRVVRLITLLDPTLASPSKLRAILSEMHTPAEMMRSRAIRSALIRLLPSQDAEVLAKVLSLQVSGDLYNGLERMSVPLGSPREQLLFDFFEIPYAQVASEPEAPAVQEGVALYQLFPHQRAASRRVMASLGLDPHRVLLHMPTGAGKTRTAMNIVCSHLRRTEPSTAIWLAYSEELCEQAAQEFVAAWGHLGDRALPVHRYWGTRALDITSLSDGFVVASLSKLYRTAMSSIHSINALAQCCSLVIIDEAHQAVAETYRLVLDALVVQRRSTALLGLTATPGRTWSDIRADEELAEFFGRRKVTLTISGYRNPIDYLVTEGYLARAEFKTLLMKTGFRLSPADLNMLQKELDIPASILERLGEDEQRNLAIILEVERLARRHSRMLVFATSVTHSNLLAGVLRARGWHADSVTGATPGTKRARVIMDFKDDGQQPKILCNYGVLTTGFDAPRTSAALIARPTKSLVLYSQMVGRAIRGPRAGGNSTAEIVTVVDPSLPGFGDVAEAFGNWEDVWREQ